MENLIELFKSLSDETRLRILNLLYERELCVCHIMAVLDIPQSNASRHLSRLKHAGLVRGRREAQWMYYSLAGDREKLLLGDLVINRLRGTDRCREDLKLLSKRLAGETCK
ncbi:MAG: metalloregulator ArsR/SmtB family transcription factor [Synergistaceae bacterium]|jgi:DNA-binding transcriptional ArsR family regulator|nr:metalloregulator ArsR/SmtB family transcription factor [Synergistaceae bacterium]